MKREKEWKHHKRSNFNGCRVKLIIWWSAFFVKNKNCTTVLAQQFCSPEFSTSPSRIKTAQHCVGSHCSAGLGCTTQQSNVICLPRRDLMNMGRKLLLFGHGRTGLEWMCHAILLNNYKWLTAHNSLPLPKARPTQTDKLQPSNSHLDLQSKVWS